MGIQGGVGTLPLAAEAVRARGGGVPRTGTGGGRAEPQRRGRRIVWSRVSACAVVLAVPAAAAARLLRIPGPPPSSAASSTFVALRHPPPTAAPRRACPRAAAFSCGRGPPSRPFTRLAEVGLDRRRAPRPRHCAHSRQNVRDGDPPARRQVVWRSPGTTWRRRPALERRTRPRHPRHPLGRRPAISHPRAWPASAEGTMTPPGLRRVSAQYDGVGASGVPSRKRVRRRRSPDRRAARGVQTPSAEPARRSGE
ncbi:hypothetical protein SAFG77S_08172 [Streptomyces afghaniensis]